MAIHITYVCCCQSVHTYYVHVLFCQNYNTYSVRVLFCQNVNTYYVRVLFCQNGNTYYVRVLLSEWQYILRTCVVVRMSIHITYVRYLVNLPKVSFQYPGPSRLWRNYTKLFPVPWSISILVKLPKTFSSTLVRLYSGETSQNSFNYPGPSRF
jgi:hypothetical protein